LLSGSAVTVFNPQLGQVVLLPNVVSPHEEQRLPMSRTALKSDSGVLNRSSRIASAQGVGL
jgi:hypothetical protein